MKKTWITALLLLTVIAIVACNQNKIDFSKNNPDRKQQETFGDSLQLRISLPQGQEFALAKTITDRQTVNEALRILSQIPWENAKVSMSRPPDYKIETVNPDPTASYEPVLYDLWITPQKDQFEVVIEGQSKYGKIPQADSVRLLAIMKSP